MMSSLRLTEWAFRDAVPAAQCALPYNDEAAFHAHGSTMSEAEISCAASHIAILSSFVEESEAAFLVVLEDDILIDPNFNIENYLRFMELAEVDYLKLYARFLVPAQFIEHYGRQVLYRFLFPPLGTQAYILSRSGAGRLLQAVRAKRHLDRPIDQIFDRYWETGVPIYAFYPFPLLELNVPTSIHSPEQVKARRDKNAQFKHRGALAARVERYRTTLRRRAANRSFNARDGAIVAALRKAQFRFVPAAPPPGEGA
jgi:glycosyl transferase family 25